MDLQFNVDSEQQIFERLFSWQQISGKSQKCYHEMFLKNLSFGVDFKL